MSVLPIGHDESVSGRHWATWALLALNVVAFGFTTLASRGAEADLQSALERAYEIRLQHPDARIRADVLDRAPEQARELFGGWISRDGAADADDRALEAAISDALDALERMPAHRYGYRPGAPSALAFFTSMFVHADVWHLFGNLLFLWLAGAVIERFWRPPLFLALYLAAGAAATLAHHAIDPSSMAPLVGASGAISGLLGAFVVAHPRTRVRLVFPIPAWVLVPAWALLQLVLWLLARESTAHVAHLGGFAIGVLAAIVRRRIDHS